MKGCLQCQKQFEEKRETAKFCSDNCRVQWNRKNGKTNKLKPFQMQVLYNNLASKVEELGEIIKSGGLHIQDLTKPTHNITPITDQKPTSNIVFSIPEKPANPLSVFNEFKIELKDAKTIPEIEEIMSRVKVEVLLLPREKMMLENYAKELSKDMFND